MIGVYKKTTEGEKLVYKTDNAARASDSRPHSKPLTRNRNTPAKSLRVNNEQTVSRITDGNVGNMQEPRLRTRHLVFSN